MQLSDALIRSFQALYKESFGEEISAEEAQKQGLAVMRLIYAKEILKKGKSNEEQKCAIGDVYSRIATDIIPDD